MKFPNWFKIFWWVLLLGLTGSILLKRFEAIATGQSVPADIFIFLIFIALMLVPIFSEIEFFGIKLKKEIEELKSDINIKLGDIKTEIQTNQNQILNQTINAFGTPPPDNKLPELQEEIEKIVNSKLKEHGVTIEYKIAGRIDVPEDNLLMFQVRYNIEKQIRFIWERRFKGNNLDINTRAQPVNQIINDLNRFNIIDWKFYDILKEILSICNYAIHGEKITEKQIAFVSKNAKQILDYLSQVQ